MRRVSRLGITGVGVQDRVFDLKDRQDINDPKELKDQKNSIYYWIGGF